MNITEARIDHLSNLARLSLPGGEKEEIARELERILAGADHLERQE